MPDKLIFNIKTMKKLSFSILFLTIIILSGCNRDNSQVPNEEASGTTNGDTNGEIINNEEEQTDLNSNESDELEEANQDLVSDPVQTTDDWRVYSSDFKQVEIKYHKNWYYRRALTEELENEYYLFVEFAPTAKILQGEATSTIQFIGLKEGQTIDDSQYLETIQEVNSNRFILRTNDLNLKPVLEAMVPTFKFLD